MMIGGHSACIFVWRETRHRRRADLSNMWGRKKRPTWLMSLNVISERYRRQQVCDYCKLFHHVGVFPVDGFDAKIFALNSILQKQP